MGNWYTEYVCSEFKNRVDPSLVCFLPCMLFLRLTSIAALADLLMTSWQPVTFPTCTEVPRYNFFYAGSPLRSATPWTFKTIISIHKTDTDMSCCALISNYTRLSRWLGTTKKCKQAIRKQSSQKGKSTPEGAGAGETITSAPCWKIYQFWLVHK